jgi:hypothetical protein
MIRLPVRSLPQTRRHTLGLAPALCRDALRNVTHSTGAIDILPDRLLITLRSLAIAASHHLSAPITQTASTSRRLNAHLSSAVPFNSLFPHS